MQSLQIRLLLVLGTVARLGATLAVSTKLPAGWTSKGCYIEGTGSRALTGASYTSSTAMTEESCISYCSTGSNSFIYAGVEYADECYCGNSFQGGSTNTTASDCSMACSGNAAEPCGAGNRLNMFWSGKAPPAPPVTDPGPPGWGSIGCYTDSTGTRTLANGVQVVGGANNMSVVGCTTACKGYTYAGVEYAAECYCANSIGGSGVSVSDGCTMTCSGNSSEYCGGSSRLNVYKLGAIPASPTTAPKPATTSSNASKPSTMSSSSASAVPSTSGLPTNWAYKGCYIDNVNGRILSSTNADNSTMTVESCVGACYTSGFQVAGIEYSTQCFCGNQIIEGGAKASSDSDCAMACGGNSKEICGGPNRMSVYSNSTLTILQPPTVQNSSLPGSWQYQGCMSEGTNVRALPYQIILANNNTATNCLTQCSNFGYMTGGMEYGDECYCGDASDLTAANSVLHPDTDCQTACSGNGSYICGGQNRISTYAWTKNPLYTFSYPTGAKAGSYEMFIDGVVIPLITIAGINGKITFTEKHGTSQQANSTGAYELDPSLAPDVNTAWRTMNGVKTDVFCSAGLILPDKGGRQLNIGGWSDDSTYGIRLYWPDGSPGKNSTNDWQENRNEVHLQSGRWYPSAMTMTNGSILVVGGEAGSNGAPVPSLELLPTVGPTVFCDWLNRTDPYNLYPFLAVLPGGGIFVAYYNEARILDAGSLGTSKVLPGIPGAVNNAASGRTYPYEGTSVLMPQIAPYTDPLTVLICGGSNGGAAIALDNCVSMQPEAATPKWTLERMPSKRVMSCITALPDGTYLILNGAHQGVAGFGLATDPNLNAVLYDPTKAVGSRMSIMANTTIARLYHSEAVLMDDGRVLVSGSDPENTNNAYPQEYRVEVFNPPYILSGAARPSFTVSNKDWTYGQQVPLTVTIPSGNMANVKISLMGAVASTHGNSMGQRTFFPAMSCSGTTCTVTAPPNVNICPPGWFQVFVLDGPTPSKATWVRIGGDPGKIGNWPNFSDFKLPGV